MTIPERPVRLPSRPTRRRTVTRRRAAGGLAWLAVLLFMVPARDAAAGPKPRREFQAYDLSIVGFNEGDPWRVKAAEVEGLIDDPDVLVWEFEGSDWMARPRKGQLVPARDVAGRLPERAPGDLFRVYRFDMDGDRAPEFLIVGGPRLVEAGVRVAPTLVSLPPLGARVLWHGGEMSGERFRVADIRDLDGDLEPELVIAGEGGQSGAYQFMAIVARAAKRFQVFLVQHVDSVHFVDLDRDGKVEIVHRERVGRKGAAHQWTYIDHLLRWNGATFESALPAFPRYHDEQTLPGLIGDLIDNHDARLPILEEKVDAIQKVRASTQTGRPQPRAFRQKKVQALAQLQRQQWKKARVSLDSLHAAWPFDVQVQLGLARVHSADGSWLRVLEHATRALTLDPRARESWYEVAAALVQLQERSSALGALVLSVVLGGSRDAGVDWLRARRGEPGMDSELQALIDEALAELGRMR